MTLSRRKFFTGLAATLVTAPAIVRAASLMPVKVMPTEDVLALYQRRMAEAYRITRANLAQSIYGDLVGVTRRAWEPRLFADIYCPRYEFKEIAAGFTLKATR